MGLSGRRRRDRRPRRDRGAARTGRAVVGAVDEDGVGVWGEVKTGTGVVGVVHEGPGAGVSGRNEAAPFASVAFVSGA